MLRARDTSAWARERQLEALRAMTPAERLAITAAMSDEIRAIAKAGLRDRHPTYSEAQVADALAHILLGRDLAEDVDRLRLAKTR